MLGSLGHPNHQSPKPPRYLVQGSVVVRALGGAPFAAVEVVSCDTKSYSKI